MKLSEAIEGFLLFKSGENLSGRSLERYKGELLKLVKWANDPEIETITSTDLLKFFDYLKNEYVPKRFNGRETGLSSQSIRNAWTAIRSFYTWAGIMLDLPDIMNKKVPRPKVTNKEVVPFSREEIQALLKEVKPVKARKPRSGARYVQQLRDQAMMLMLLDTGIRASEICSLTVGDVHMKSGRVSVMGKGAKHRHVQIGSTTRTKLWQYLNERENGDNPTSPLFVGSGDNPVSREWLRKNLHQIGERANVPNCHPHRFRYTFAIEYLRAGGDVFTLQKLLGHSSLKMVMHYARLAGADIERMHRTAGPVDNWLR